MAEAKFSIAEIATFAITATIAFFPFGCGKGVVNNEEPNVPLNSIGF